jgi:serine/threonine protein kinase
LASVPFEPHLRFGQRIGGRYHVFRSVRHERVFSLTRGYDLAEDKPVFLFTFPQAIFRDFPQARAQIQFEAERLQRLSSPFLLNLRAAGETGEHFFFVEEAPRGGSLSEALRTRRRRNQPFSDREALGLTWLLCRVLEVVQESAVHGFLHPLEVYLEPWPDGPIAFYPRIAHVGIRAMLRAVLRIPFEGLQEEAACYASPEFESYGPLQKQVDVYGAGAILYALLTLRAPTGCFVRPSTLRPGLSKEIDRILLRALDEDPDERYPTPDVFAGALEGQRALSTFRHELERASGRLSSGAVPPGPSVLEIGVPEGRRHLQTRGESDLTEMLPGKDLAFASVLSDRVRAACLVLLMLLNLGLVFGAAMEAGSSRRDDPSDSEEFMRWQSMFSDAGRGEPGGPIGAG